MKKVVALMLGTLIVSMSAFSSYASEEAVSEDAVLSQDTEVTGSDQASEKITLSEDGEVTLGDYSVITLQQNVLDVSDDTVMSYIDSMSTDLTAAFSDIFPEEPEITDEIMSEYSEAYYGVQLDTVEAAKAYIRETLYNQNYRAAFFAELLGNAQVVSYSQKEYDMMKEYAENEIAYYASVSQITEDEMAQKAGFVSAEDFIEQEARSLVLNALVFDKILDDLGIECTQEDVDAALTDYIVSQGMATSDELEEFKESAGETWLWLFTETQYKAEKVYEALQDRVVIE